jgi:hypothetical protein
MPKHKSAQLDLPHAEEVFDLQPETAPDGASCEVFTAYCRKLSLLEGLVSFDGANSEDGIIHSHSDREKA